MSAVPCPRCQRNNAPHRASCLYCGAEMPNPTAPPPERAPTAMPEDLDRLVKQAMATGNTGHLQQALAQAREEAARRAVVAPEARAGRPPAEPEELPDSALEGEALPSLDAGAVESLEEVEGEAAVSLEVLLDRARSALGQPEQELAALEALGLALESRVSELRQHLEEPPTDEVLVVDLPPFRQPYGLVVEGPGEDGLTREVAQVTGLDGVTARMIAVSSHPRIALRGDDRAALEELAGRFSGGLGLRARVVSREELLAMAPPQVVLAAAGERRLRVDRHPWWTREVEPGALPRGELLDLEEVTLVLPGEVVIKRFRTGRTGTRRSRNDEALVALRDKRVAVVDLHGPGGSWRVVEGITRFEGLPGFVASSVRRSVRALPEALLAWYPEALVVAPRVCQPVREARASEGVDAGQGVQVDGWGAWEEHTRACRLLFEVGRG